MTCGSDVGGGSGGGIVVGRTVSAGGDTLYDAATCGSNHTWMTSIF
jgi:hypothetical protein